MFHDTSMATEMAMGFNAVISGVNSLRPIDVSENWVVTDAGNGLSITVTSKWARLHLKSPASLLFAQLFVQTQIKVNIKALCHWPLWGESTSDWWIPLTKGR